MFTYCVSYEFVMTLMMRRLVIFIINESRNSRLNYVYELQYNVNEKIKKGSKNAINLNISRVRKNNFFYVVIII